MSYDILKKEIKEKKLRNIYLFYGQETYLRDYYLNQIDKLMVNQSIKEMNFLLMDENGASIQGIIEFCDNPPVMSDKKLLVIKKTNFLKNKKSGSGTDIERLLEYLDTIPDYIVIVFVEGTEIDKRNSIYKYIEKNGLVSEFIYQSREQIANWVERIFKDANKKVTKEDILYIVDNTNPDMQSILNECNKLIDYSLDKDVIELKEIQSVLTKSLNSRVFEMIDNIISNNTKKALEMLGEMLFLKEPTPKILSLIARQIKLLLQVKVYTNEGLSQNEIAKRIELKYVYKFIKQGEKFSVERLEKLLLECSSADMMIKTSSVDDKIILEKLIMQIAIPDSQ